MANKDKKYVISKEKVWQAKKPKFNGFAGGYGAHGDTKYNRKKDKLTLEKIIEDSKD